MGLASAMVGLVSREGRIMRKGGWSIVPWAFVVGVVALGSGCLPPIEHFKVGIENLGKLDLDLAERFTRGAGALRAAFKAGELDREQILRLEGERVWRVSVESDCGADAKSFQPTCFRVVAFSFADEGGRPQEMGGVPCDPTEAYRSMCEMVKSFLAKSDDLLRIEGQVTVWLQEIGIVSADASWVRLDLDVRVDAGPPRAMEVWCRRAVVESGEGGRPAGSGNEDR